MNFSLRFSECDNSVQGQGELALTDYHLPRESRFEVSEAPHSCHRLENEAGVSVLPTKLRLDSSAVCTSRTITITKVALPQ